MDRLSLCGLFLLAAIALPHLQAAQVTEPEPAAQSQDARRPRVSDKNDSPKLDKPTAKTNVALAKDIGEFELSVVGQDGKPIPEVLIELRAKTIPTVEQIRQGTFVRSDDHKALVTANSEGRFVMAFPPNPGGFDVRIVMPGYGLYRANWSSEQDSHQVPAKFTAELEKGLSMGGIVVDVAGNPIPGVRIRPNINFKNRPGDTTPLEVGTAGTTVTTDSAGAWRFDSLPDSRIGFSAVFEHPDFVRTHRKLLLREFRLEKGREFRQRITLVHAAAVIPNVLTNSIGMKLVEIPAGEFMMGAAEDWATTLNKFPSLDPKWLDAELPRHKVRITKSFYMGQYEVTQQEFVTFYEEAKSKVGAERDEQLLALGEFGRWRLPGQMGRPVVQISWSDAVAFCHWLSKKEGETYRLPTEAEWEYACRAGASSEYFFGDDPEELIHYANAADADAIGKSFDPKTMTDSFDRNGNKLEKQIPFPFLSGHDGHAWLAPVGRFKPNAFGLYDMHGNAWEWCSDLYDKHYYIDSPTADPQGPSTGTSRVARGGGAFNRPACLRCAGRYDASPSDRGHGDIGFRVVRVK